MAVQRPKCRLEDLVVQETNGEVLIYDLRTNKAFCLNETSGVIWKACDGTRNVEGIRNYFFEKTRTEASEDLVWLALNQLKKEKLLEKAPEDGGRFSGMSRREVVKKVALGTAIAIPVVAGMVAPLPVHANSSCVTVLGGCACTMGSGPNGALCTSVITPCSSPNCRCFKANNSGGAGSGDCVP